MILRVFFQRRAPILVLLFALSCALLAATGCATSSEHEEKAQNIKDAEWHYQMAAGYFESQEIALAIRELHTALELNPEEYRAHYLLGFIQMGRRKYPEAMRHFKETLRLEPEYNFARNNLGAVYLSLERWEEAVEVFSELLDDPLYTTPELAHNNLGWAYYKLRNYPEAVEHLKMAKFLKPGMCLAYNNLGRTYEQMSQGSKAIREYRRAIRRCPDNYAEPHFYLAKLLQAREEPEAREHFEQCVKIQPDSNLADRCRQYLQVH